LVHYVQLAEAAYAHLVDSAGALLSRADEVQQALQDVAQNMSFSSKQAKNVVDNWHVLSQQPNTVTGFSATLYSNKNNSRDVLISIRGTELHVELNRDIGAGLGDIVLDGLAFDQLVDLYNYWQYLSAPQGGAYVAARWVDFDPRRHALADVIMALPSAKLITIEKGSSDVFFSGSDRALGSGLAASATSVAVTGHSLGGHLAAAFTRLFPETGASAVVVNGAGFVTANPNVDRVFRLLGGANSFDAGRIINLYAEKGPEIVAQNWYLQQAGGHFPIFTETAIGYTLGHGVGQVTDSVAVYDVFIRLSTELQTSSISDVLALLKPLFKASSARADASLEAVVDSLVKLFGLEFLPLVPGNLGDRDELYQRIIALGVVADDLASQVVGSRVDVLSHLNPYDLFDKAMGETGIGYRYALSVLDPFAVVGNDAMYTRHEESGRLALFNHGDDGHLPNSGVITEKWLRDRAGLLHAVLVANINDNPDIARIPGGGNGSTEYHYYSSNVERVLFSDPAGGAAGKRYRTQFVAFADDAGRTLNGTDYLQGDSIYGGLGDDTLIGGEGNDYLEGGRGHDVYVWNTGDGFDVVRDIDGRGTVVLDNVPLQDVVKVADSIYVTPDRKHFLRYLDEGGGKGALVVDGALMVLDFRDGDFGITLTAEGGLEGWHENLMVHTEPFWASGLGFGSDGNDYAVLAESMFVSKAGDDVLLLAEGGSGAIFAGPGNDLLIGADTYLYDFRAQLIGDAGADTILGGANDELIEGDVDFYYALDSFWLPTFNFRGNFSAGTPEGEGHWGALDLNEPDYVGIEVVPFQGTYVEAIRYALGITDTTDIATHYDDYIDGGPGDDVINGGYGSDVIYGGEGNDIIWADERIFWSHDRLPMQAWLLDALHLFGAPGDDFIDGGPGDDVLGDRVNAGSYGYDGQVGGNDLFFGGTGNDAIYNLDPDPFAGAVNYLYGGDGDDFLYSENASPDGYDYLFGEEGNDRLGIVAHSALLDGAEGNDEYVILLTNAAHESWTVAVRDVDVDGNDSDTLRILSVVTEGETVVSFTRDEWSLRVGINSANSDGEVVIEYWFVPWASGRIENLVVEDRVLDVTGQTVHTVRTFGWQEVESRFSLATAGDDFLWGSELDDLMAAQDGDDQLFGGAGNDFLYGGTGSDVLAGGRGDDVLDGGLGDDTYRFDVGDGRDVLVDEGGNDTLSFGEGIHAEDIILSFQAGFIVRVGPYGDQIRIDGVDPDDLLGTAVLEQFRFLDGTELNLGELVGRGFDIGGTDGADTIVGTNLDDRLFGHGSNDVLSGGAGNDVLDGGFGDDVLIGGAGRNVYRYGSGYGIDHIVVTAGEDYVIELLGHLSIEQVPVSRTGDGLILEFGDGNQLSVSWQTQQGLQGVVRAQSGKVWSLEDLAARAVVQGPGTGAVVPESPVPDDQGSQDGPVPGSVHVPDVHVVQPAPQVSLSPTGPVAIEEVHAVSLVQDAVSLFLDSTLMTSRVQEIDAGDRIQENTAGGMAGMLSAASAVNEPSAAGGTHLSESALLGTKLPPFVSVSDSRIGQRSSIKSFELYFGAEGASETGFAGVLGSSWAVGGEPDTPRTQDSAKSGSANSSSPNILSLVDEIQVSEADLHSGHAAQEGAGQSGKAESVTSVTEVRAADQTRVAWARMHRELSLLLAQEFDDGALPSQTLPLGISVGQGSGAGASRAGGIVPAVELPGYQLPRFSGLSDGLIVLG